MEQLNIDEYTVNILNIDTPGLTLKELEDTVSSIRQVERSGRASVVGNTLTLGELVPVIIIKTPGCEKVLDDIVISGLTYNMFEHGIVLAALANSEVSKLLDLESHNDS